MTLIPELQKPNTDHGSNNKCEDADIYPATDQTDINLANEVAVEFQVLTFLGDVVCPASMFDMDKIIGDPSSVCAAKHMRQSVGDQTSMMSICIHCNRSAYHFCAEYLSEQKPADLDFVIMVKDVTNESKICSKKTNITKV